MDLKLDKLTNDIVITAGDMVTISGIDEAGQRIKDRLLTFQNEWFLNLSYGVDYIGTILIKNPRTGVVASHLRAQILKSVNGEITAFSSDFSNRELSINYSIIIDDETLTEEVTL